MHSTLLNDKNISASLKAFLYLLTLLTIATLLRIYYIQSIPTNHDEIVYYKMADIFKTGEYSIKLNYKSDYLVNKYNPAQHRPHYPPIYPFFIFIIKKITGLDLSAPSVVSVIFGVLTVAIAFMCGNVLSGPGAGLLAGALLAFNPLHIIFSSRPISESTTLFFITASTLLLILSEESKHYLILIFISVILAGLGALTHSGDILFLIAIFLWGLFFSRSRKFFFLCIVFLSPLGFAALTYKFRIPLSHLFQNPYEVMHKLFAFLSKQISLKRMFFTQGVNMFASMGGLSAYMSFLLSGYARNYVGVLIQMAVFPFFLLYSWVHSFYVIKNENNKTLKKVALFFLIVSLVYIIGRSGIYYRDNRYIFPVILLGCIFGGALLSTFKADKIVKSLISVIIIILPFWISIKAVEYPSIYGRITLHTAKQLNKILEDNAIVITPRWLFVELYLKRNYLSYSIINVSKSFINLRSKNVYTVVKKGLDQHNPFYLLLDNWSVQNRLETEHLKVIPLETIGDFYLFKIVDKSTPIINPKNNLTFGFSLKVVSGGWFAGNTCEIKVNNGRNLAPGGRGINIVSLDTSTGKLKKRGRFDTYFSEEESEKLENFINNIAPGDVVALCVYDEASYHLTESAQKALFSLGAQQSLIGKYRYSYALIGIKGADRGTAIEGLSQDKRVILRNYGKTLVDYE